MTQSAPLHKPFTCPGCGEHCPFPTQVFDGLKQDEHPSERMTTCGCGMTHKLTMDRGAVSEMPDGIARNDGWRKARDEQDRAARQAEMAVRLARDAGFVDAGKCPHCEGTGLHGKVA